LPYLKYDVIEKAYIVARVINWFSQAVSKVQIQVKQTSVESLGRYIMTANIENMPIEDVSLMSASIQQYSN
jgi:hypothetical protein